MRPGPPATNPPADASLGWWYGPFAALSVHDLYAAMRLRQDVFVVEQACAYQDADGRDAGAHHLLGWDSDVLVACLRVLPPDAEHPDVAIGRVVVARSHRGAGLGRALMRQGLDRAAETHGPVSVFVSAQAHLRAFYEELGFAVCGDGYLEDGIPHLPMRRAGAGA